MIGALGNDIYTGSSDRASSKIRMKASTPSTAPNYSYPQTSKADLVGTDSASGTGNDLANTITAPEPEPAQCPAAMTRIGNDGNFLFGDPARQRWAAGATISTAWTDR
jgi:hypothetical protein